MNQLKQEKLVKGLVSIIMPAYNSQEFIPYSIQSVINQTYKNWELIVVDDCSTDRTAEIVEKFSQKYDQITFIQLETNSGAAVARNRAIEEAKGEYMAFLDSDDLWEAEKLSTQISFMQVGGKNFTCTSYEFINDKNEWLGKKKEPLKEHDYNDVLKYCPGNSTVMYNVEELGKFYIPNIRKRNDFVMWLQVIKKAGTLYGIQETYTYYRVREDSLSINKTGLVKYQWKVYRDIENLGLLKSIYLLAHKVFSVVTQ